MTLPYREAHLSLDNQLLSPGPLSTSLLPDRTAVAASGFTDPEVAMLARESGVPLYYQGNVAEAATSFAGGTDPDFVAMSCAVAADVAGGVEVVAGGFGYPGGCQRVRLGPR